MMRNRAFTMAGAATISLAAALAPFSAAADAAPSGRGCGRLDTSLHGARAGHVSVVVTSRTASGAVTALTAVDASGVTTSNATTAFGSVRAVYLNSLACDSRVLRVARN